MKNITSPSSATSKAAGMTAPERDATAPQLWSEPSTTGGGDPATRVDSTTNGAKTTSTHDGSSTGSKKVKKEQHSKLHRIKYMTIGSVVLVDLMLIGALTAQLLSFEASLKGFHRDKVVNTFKFFHFQYGERFGFSELALTRYSNTTRPCKALVQHDAAEIRELRRQFTNDRLWRTNEAIALVNSSGYIITSSGPASASGHRLGIGDLEPFFAGGSTPGAARVRSALHMSVMVEQDLYYRVGAPLFDAVGDYRPDLVSWVNQEQTLARVVLMPVYCSAQADPQGFLLNVDSVFPRQYDYFGTLLFSTRSGMGGIFARNTNTNQWQTAFSYNQPGPDGAQSTRFPDMARDIFTSDQLQQAIADGPDAIGTGTFVYDGVSYVYAISSVSHVTLDGHVVGDTTADDFVYAYAEPDAPVRQTLHRAMAYQIPWIVVLVLWSVLSVQYVLKKFVEPMQHLIDSVKKKHMKAFNDLLRQLRANRGAIWGLLVKVVVTESVLVILVFVNDALLESVFPNFTSAVTEGRVLSYVTTSQASNLLYYLAAWSASPTFLSALQNRTSTADLLNPLLSERRHVLEVDAICVLGLNAEILASSHAASVGYAFPETGVMEHLLSQRSPEEQRPFLAQASWTELETNRTTPGLDRGPLHAPALTRLIVAPIRSIAVNETTGELLFGDLVGAVVIVRFLNGARAIWNVDDFTPGFFGMFIWDRFQGVFQDLTSVLKNPNGALVWDQHILDQNPELLQTGLMSQFNPDRVVVEPDVRLLDQTFSLSIVPFWRADEIVLSPSTTNAYVLRGLSQTPWNRVRNQLLYVQIFTMAIVILSALMKIVLAWMPLRRFLNSLERVFTVQSVCDEVLVKRETAAVALLTAKATSATVTKPTGMPSRA